MCLKWHEMQIVRHGRCSLDLGCNCGGFLLTHPPSSGLLGSPLPVDDMLNQAILPVFPPMETKELWDWALSCEGTSHCPQPGRRCKTSVRGSSFEAKTSLWLPDIFHPLLKLPIRGTIMVTHCNIKILHMLVIFTLTWPSWFHGKLKGCLYAIMVREMNIDPDCGLWQLHWRNIRKTDNSFFPLGHYGWFILCSLLITVHNYELH